MLRTLLDVSRAGSGARLALDLGPCDLVAVVRGIVERLELSHGDRFVVVAPGEVRGQWSADALGRAVENLVANALKYGDPHQPVTITVATEHGRASVAVHNHGSFIPQRERESLFEAFRRSEKAESSVRGWGLGLALVRAVAEAHGGSIAVESLAGMGTTFLVDLPLDARPFQKTIATPTP
jgi:signal transduction histidine kinase